MKSARDMVPSERLPPARKLECHTKIVALGGIVSTALRIAMQIDDSLLQIVLTHLLTYHSRGLDLFFHAKNYDTAHHRVFDLHRT